MSGSADTPFRCTGAGAPNPARGLDNDHCCYLRGRRCSHLRENVAGRRYACGLLIDYGTWEAMNASPEYEAVGRFWQSIGLPFNYCEQFDPAFCCRPELRAGRGSDKPELVY